MKVALIHARVDNHTVPPLGLLSIAGVLREIGIWVTVWDPSLSNQDILEEIVKFRPEIIGVSLMTAEYARAKEIIGLLRRKIPQVLYVCGGCHISALPEESLIELNADVAVVGEGELTMRELCSNLVKGSSWKEIKGISYRESGRIYHNPRRALIEELDILPFTGRELLKTPFAWYLVPPGVIRGDFYTQTTTMITSRGCPYKCIFCASNIIFNHRIRRRSVENVIAEILYLKNKYGVKGIWFLDDCFTFGRSWVNAFCSELRNKKIMLIWSCQSRVDTLDEDLLRQMKLAGCVQVEIGIESGSSKVLRALHKGIHLRDVEEKVDMMKQIDLRVLVNLMIGNPEEDIDDIMTTYRLIKRLKPDFVIFNVCMPYPGSGLYRMAQEKGWLRRYNLEFNSEWSEYFTTTGVMHINIEPRYLLKLRAKFQNLFFWRNYSSIIKGFLYSPRLLLILNISVIFYLRENLINIWKLLKKRKFDALIWDFYAYYSDMARKLLHS